MKKFIPLALIAVITGCSQVQIQEITTPRVPLIIKPNANPAFFAKRRNGTNRVFEVELRTFSNNGDKVTEVIGATCKVETAEFLINAVTPAKISVPIMQKGASDTMTITCKKDTKNGTKVFTRHTFVPTPSGNPLADGIARGIAEARQSQVYFGVGDVYEFYISINLQ
jgi:hypothetical protein